MLMKKRRRKYIARDCKTRTSNLSGKCRKHGGAAPRGHSGSRGGIGGMLDEYQKALRRKKSLKRARKRSTRLTT